MRHPITRSDQCAFPRCRAARAVEYLGRGLCRHHWNLLADSEGEAEAALLRDLALQRILNDVVEMP